MELRVSPLRYVVSVSLVVVGMLAARPLAAQSEVFDDTVDVRIVSIDVFVTDKAGRPVRGLTRDDFIVRQDGRLTEVTNFSRFEAEPGSRTSAPVPEAAPPGTPLGDGIPPEPQSLIVYVDNTTLLPAHRNRVLDELRRFVFDQLPQGVEVTVVVNKPGLEILAEATASTEEIERGFERLSKMSATGIWSHNERRQARGSIEDIYRLYAETGFQQAGFNPCVDGWEQMIGAVDVYAQAAGTRLASAQGSLLGLVRSLGGVPGRKSLLYLSDGLEQRPGIDFYAFLGELCPEREQEMISYMTRWDETSTLHELTEYANASRVTLYALETAGLRNYSASSVEFDSKRFSPSARNDSLRISNLQNSLFILADETGGKAFFNTNSPGPELERVSADFENYYSLGFAPPSGWDGATHAIRVELIGKRAKGTDLRYRRRYRAIPDEERMAERTLATLVLGWEDNPLGAEIRVGEQKPLSDKRFIVPVEVVLEAASLGSLDDRAGARRLIRVVMIAEDGKGRRSTMREKLIPLEPIETAAVTSVVVNLELPPGPHTVAVGIRDEIERVTSFRRVFFEVGRSGG